jgi:glutamine---fructose-6-phosphate transaminase (isomerizing)
MDRREASQTGQVRQQVLSKPQLIRDIFPKFDRQARQMLDHEMCLNIHRLIAGGSGDSHNAALATEMFFELVAKLPMEVLSGMGLSRYSIPWLPSQEITKSMVIGISVSGEVSRTVEAMRCAGERGGLTLGVTMNPHSSLGAACRLVFDTTLPPPVESPGVRAYAGSVLAMYALGLRLAEVREAISQTTGNRWRKAILNVADVIENTNACMSENVKATARALKDKQCFMYLGSGPNYATALFGAAKVVEASGQHVIAQDIEEWAHLQRFDKEQGTPCFVIAPPGIGYGRAIEVADFIHRTGKYLIAIVEVGEKTISGMADAAFFIHGHVPEILTPLVYCSPLELFASDLAQELGEPYFRDGEEPWVSAGGNTVIRASQTCDLETIQQQVSDDLRLSGLENG